MDAEVVVPMTRSEKRERQRTSKRKLKEQDHHEEFTTVFGEKIRALTEAQGHYIIDIQSSDLTFGIGPAGTGKTYVCAAMAAQALVEKKTSKIILTRPAVEAGEKLGFLPGELNEKYEPYLMPFMQTFNDVLGKSHTENLIRNKKIEPIPLGYMRGMTFDNAWVILDEAQNTTPTQMKMFLTRIGRWSKVIVNGDITQKDISSKSGLLDAVDRLAGLSGVAVSVFGVEDVVRSELVKGILERYSE